MELIHKRLAVTAIHNKIIEHIKDNDAFRMYCLLLASDNTVPHFSKYEIKENKIGLCLSYLERCGLIKVDSKTIVVLDIGYKAELFNENESFLIN